MADAYIWCSNKETSKICHCLFCCNKNPYEIEPIPIDSNLYIEELSIDQNIFEREVLCQELENMSSEEGSSNTKTKKDSKLQMMKKNFTSPKIALRKAKVKPMKSTPDNLYITNTPSTESLL